MQDAAQGPSGPSQKTIKRLFALSGNRCAFPKCEIELVQEATVLGEICHIKGASINGPRYDPDQSLADRHDFDNLILLCANHHKVVDDDEVAYTVQRLEEMKHVHEASANPLADEDASIGAAQILSIGQSGGLVVGAVHAHTINIHPTHQSTTDHSPGDTALVLLIPELARLLARQIYILDRAIVNFVSASAKQSQPPDHWTTFRPWKPRLYRSTTEFRDLPPAHAELFAEFFEGLAEIDDLIMSWKDSEIAWDMNLWNVLMQKIERNVISGVRAVERFCPERQYDNTMPASGTLIERAQKSTSMMYAALDAHIRRYTAASASTRPMRRT